jgi:hypothetical protein
VSLSLLDYTYPFPILDPVKTSPFYPIILYNCRVGEKVFIEILSEIASVPQCGQPHTGIVDGGGCARLEKVETGDGGIVGRRS